MTKKTENVA